MSTISLPAQALSFRRGNTYLIVMQNFEALGKYTAAMKQAAKFREERDRALSNVSDLTRRFQNEATVSTQNFARNFDPAMVQGYVDEAAMAHQNMLQAIEEANTVADAAGESPLKIQG